MSERHDGHMTSGSVASIIATELRHHMPFTAIGALSGIAVMTALALCKVPRGPSGVLFEIMHAAHVLLSAVATTAMFRRYRPSILAAIVTGVVGSVGLGTLSDVVLPHLGGLVVRAEMHFHLPAIEEPWLVWPAAAAGVGIGLWRRKTKLPHSGHVFVSTWASLFYLTSQGSANWLPRLPGIFAVLFVAVWVPCCFSDILFPLLIAGRHAAKEHQH